MIRPSHPLWRPVVLFVLAFMLLLAAGALQQRLEFLTRGIPSSLPQPIAHAGVELGLNVALDGLDPAQLDDALQRIAASGVRTIKQPFFFDEPYQWPASDRLAAAVAASDLELVALLDGNPAQNFAPPADVERFAAWAGEFARRYGSGIRYYIIWDEPNLSSHWGQQPVNAADYTALLAASASAIRAADEDAVIVAAPLAPTTESGPQNLSDVQFLKEMYGAGARDFFDVGAGKPYGFDRGPGDRTVEAEVLNFSRAILLREVMVANGDEHKPLFAGNWGWNSLPSSWQGPPSIWGQVDETTRVTYTRDAIQRARREWPWMGLMFLEIWEAPEGPTDPHHGFDVLGTALETALPELTAEPDVAYPGFHRANSDAPEQSYRGDWRFSPKYGADISQTGDSLTFRFWGTSAGLRVRRADYRARLYVTIDGEPATKLPHDGNGAALVLTSPDASEDYLETVLVAKGLQAGSHEMTVEAYRGWEQWALNGFSVAYAPDMTPTRVAIALLLGAALILFLGGIREARRVSWRAVIDRRLQSIDALSNGARLALTLAAAAIVVLTGWLTWGEQAAGIYRRLGDGSQLALTAAVASVFYVAPSFVVYVPALLFLLFLIFTRPAWGLALVALFFPFYVLPKPMGVYRFSPVEIFVLLTTAATVAASVARVRRELVDARRNNTALQGHFLALWRRLKKNLVAADYATFLLLVVATISLLFTERLDVAQNEWRVVIVEPILFYALFRLIHPTRDEVRTIIDAFVLGAVTVAVYGLWQYAMGENVITVAGGLSRLRSIYGSPNNVALYLGRVAPILLAVALMGWISSRRRLLYTLALLPVAASLALTFSKGALFLGLPAGLGLVFLLWLRSSGRRVWPWLIVAIVVIVVVMVALLAIPGLAARLDIQGASSVLRLSLWQASLNMFAEHPLFGVGLDNFLYAYRGRYILESGWEEPNLNHPHNIILDFATRLGVAGLLAGAWLVFTLIRMLWRLPKRVSAEWRPIAIGISGSVAQMLAHGSVDHSFFLVDLSFAFFLLLALAVWLQPINRVTFEARTG